MLDWLTFIAVIAVFTLLVRVALGRVLRRSTIVWIIAVLLSFIIASVLTYEVSRARSFQLFGHFVASVPTGEKVVALTFDDGPTSYVPTLLELLRREQVTATFFVIGAEMQHRPDLAALIAREGHELANHSYSHDHMVFKSERWIAREIERTDALIRQAGYRGPIQFRSPFGKRFVSLPFYLARHDRLNIYWDVDSDSNRATAGDTAAIVRDAVTKTKPGSIILLHLMYSNREATREALPQIVEALRARGYRFVTVSELLRLRGR